ncbi:hypothetical protein [Streptomyces sp. ODS28]|uniref:hypothetical protein n=1 Tax=Streptomyces sp. ODS28 TaxID=3136688 RepID=UPI0031EAE9E9
MDAGQARSAEAVLRAAGVPGVVAPVDPRDPEGEWRVYDSADPAARTDTTAAALTSAVAAFRDAPAQVARDRPAMPPGSRSVRGFILPPDGEG